MSSQLASPAADSSTATTASASTKVCFSFSGANRKQQPAAPSALTTRLSEGRTDSTAAGSASALISDGSALFQSLSAISSSSAAPSTAPLVIPLKQGASWRERALAAKAAVSVSPAATNGASATAAARADASTSQQTAASATPLTLQQQAEQQLLASAHTVNGDIASTVPAELYNTFSIPLHQHNNGASRPLDPAPLPTSTAAAAPVDEPRYTIPVEEFGVALLRGMGWKGPGDAVGGANKADVQPVLTKRREDRMGLGADTAANQSAVLPHQRGNKDTIGSGAAGAAKKAATAGVRQQGAAASLRAKVGSRVLALVSQQLRVDALVYIAAGRHRRQYGRVREMAARRTERVKVEKGEREEKREEEEQYTLEVKLNSGECVSVDSADVDVLDERALPDDHPAFGRVKEEEQSSERRDENSERGGQRSSRGERDNRPEKRHKSSHPPSSTDAAASITTRSSPPPRPSSPSRARSDGRPVWCAPQLRVRIVSRSLASGSCFRCKARVTDVHDASTIELRLDDGRAVTASERQLETVIPTDRGRAVLVVGGKLKGQMASLIERDSKRGVATIQMEDDMRLHILSFDDICERER